MVVIRIVYGLYTDSPNLYENIQQSVEEINCANIIWCGYFNLVLNPELHNNPKAREKVKGIRNHQRI